MVTSSISLSENGLTFARCRFDHADDGIPAQERHAEQGAIATLGLRLRPSVIGILEHVPNVQCPAFEGGAAGHRAPAGDDRILRQVAQEHLIVAGRGDQVIPAVRSEGVGGRPVRMAEAGGGGHDGVQHRLQIGG